MIGPDAYGIIDSTLKAADSCYAGNSILQAVAATGIFNLDIVDQANTAFADVDFGTIGTIDLDGTLSSNPTSDTSSSSNVDLSGMTITPFTQINNDCTDLLADLSLMKSQLLRVTANDLSNSSAFPDWLTKLGSVLPDFDTAVNLTNAVQRQSTNLSDTIVSTNDTAKAMISVSSTIVPLYNEGTTQIRYFAGNASVNVRIFFNQQITAAIPNIKTQILANIVLDVDVFHTRLNCSPVANDFVNFRQGFCGDFMTSLDAFWSTLVVLALMALLSLPTTVFIANTLFLDLTKFQEGSDQDISDRKEEPAVLKQPPVDKDFGKMTFDQAAVSSFLTLSQILSKLKNFFHLSIQHHLRVSSHRE